MTRSDLQQLAEARLQDAQVLVGAGRWDAAYYLLGYVLECALKACVAQRFGHHEVPEKKLVQDFYSHNLRELLKLAELEPEYKTRAKENPEFEQNWSLVTNWQESCRYRIGVSEVDVESMIHAITNPKSGVLTWLKTRW